VRRLSVTVRRSRKTAGRENRNDRPLSNDRS
jgi:hypothetical protein